MYKVLVVDDEKIVRIALKTMIKWEQHGFHFAGSASDGKAGLALAEKWSPDIIITDLKMPKLDGLAFIEQLKERGFRGKIVALSNYGDYELVRKALLLGATDYLLKITLKPQDLLALMKKMAAEMEQERKVAERHVQVDIALREKHELEKYRYFHELLAEEKTDHRIWKEGAERLSLSLSGELSLFYVAIEQFEHVMVSGKIKDSRLLSFSVSNIMAETLSAIKHVEIIAVSAKEYAVLLPIAPRAEAESVKLHLAEQVWKALHVYLNLRVIIAVSADFSGLDKMRSIFESCKQAFMQQQFYETDVRIVFEKQVKCASNDSLNLRAGWKQEWSEALQGGEMGKLCLLLEEGIKVICMERLSPAYLKSAVYQWFEQVLDVKEGRHPDEQAEERKVWLQELRKQLLQVVSITEMEFLLKRSIQELLLFLPNAKELRYRPEVRSVIDYLKRNLSHKVTLSIMAHHVNMNESYLSRLFKNETGVNLVQYLNDLRMERAMELFKDQHLMVKEVAAQVGFTDQFYFNRMFKKHTGYSPSSYQEMLQSGGSKNNPYTGQ